MSPSSEFLFQVFYFSVLNFPTVYFIAFISLPRLSIIPRVSRLLMIGCWSIAIVALRSLSNSSNICVISALVSVHCLFSCWVILGLIQDILNIILWDFGSCLNPIKDVGICFRKLSTWLGSEQALIHLLWAVVPMSIQFAKPWQCYLHVSCLCIPQWPVGDIAIQFSKYSVLCLGWDPHMHSLWVSLGVHKHFMGVSLPSFLLSIISNTFQFCGAFLFWSFSQKAWVFITLFCPHPWGQATGGQKLKMVGFDPNLLEPQLHWTQRKVLLPQSFGPAGCHLHLVS